VDDRSCRRKRLALDGSVTSPEDDDGSRPVHLPVARWSRWHSVRVKATDWSEVMAHVSPFGVRRVRASSDRPATPTRLRFPT